MIPSIETMLNKFAGLKDNWNGLGAVPIKPSTIKVARRISRLAYDLGFHEQSVSPGDDGHIFLSLMPSHDIEFDIAIENDGTCSLMYTDCDDEDNESLDLTGLTLQQVVAHIKHVDQILAFRPVRIGA